MDLRFVVRGTLVGVLGAFVFALTGIGIILSRTPLVRPPDPTPLPPTITGPRGTLPLGPVGLSEYAQYRGSGYTQVGSGFLLQLPGGDQVGVTTAHSLALGDLDRGLERVAFGIPGRAGYVIEFSFLYGAPGRAQGSEMSTDYVLLRVDGPADPRLVLSPDPRGGPQSGERVSLLSGNGGGPGERYELLGTVVSVEKGAVWVLMDKESFNPAQMSGSPFVSHHTGRVVGMVVAGSPRHVRLIPPRFRLMLGMHPIGSIVDQAKQADSFPAISTYQR